MAEGWTKALPLETERLVLRHPHFDDVTRLVRLAADLTIAQNLREMPSPFTPAHASAFIGDALASNDTGGGLAMVVARKGDPSAMIGLVSFVERADGVETGYWLGRNFRGKGYVQEALRAVLDLIWSDPAVSSIRAGVFADNPASLHILQKLGFSIVDEGDQASLARGRADRHFWLESRRSA